MSCVFVVFCAVGSETEHRLKMVDTDREHWLVGGWALAANGGECAFSLFLTYIVA